jgi:hypothetical protein
LALIWIPAFHVTNLIKDSMVEVFFMRTKGKNRARVEQDRVLDEALEQTFPASDPIALQQVGIIGQVSIIGRESKTVAAGKHADKKTNKRHT